MAGDLAGTEAMGQAPPPWRRALPPRPGRLGHEVGGEATGIEGLGQSALDPAHCHFLHVHCRATPAPLGPLASRALWGCR